MITCAQPDCEGKAVGIATHLVTVPAFVSDGFGLLDAVGLRKDTDIVLSRKGRMPVQAHTCGHAENTKGRESFSEKDITR